MEKNRIKRFNENSELNISDVIKSKKSYYHLQLRKKNY